MCAIFGIAGHSEAANLTYLGLHSLQHRGQEGAGIISTDGKECIAIKERGLVGDIFSPSKLEVLKGSSAIGHTRYSTTGSSNESNLQPFLMRTSLGWIAVAHNGNLTNSRDLVCSLEKQGSIFQSTTDTEVIVHLIAKALLPMEKAIPRALSLVEGAYSLLIINENKLYAIRDPHGFRPLVMGMMRNSPVFASETCAFDLIRAKYVREVKPGEMIVVSLDDKTYKSSFPFPKTATNRCVFEHVYFSRPDSVLYGAEVYEVRKKLGAQLAKEHPVEKGSIVMPVPDSGVPAAIGYSQECGLPFEMGLIRSHYARRTFIEPKQEIRDLGVRLKLNARHGLAGKDVVVIDDSLVRGTTSRKIIRMLKDAGAKKIHLRISAPPTAFPCVYGIDTPTKEELLASKCNIEDVRNFVGADSLGYLSLDGLLSITSSCSGKGFCHACWSGEYPIGGKLSNKECSDRKKV